MKELKIFIVILFLNNVLTFPCLAQNQYHSDVIQGYELQISNITFDSTTGDVYSIPLRNYGLLKSNYSVIVSATLKDDSIEYRIPGLITNHDRFSLLHKNGKNGNGDTVKIIRRTGNSPVVFAKMNVIAFRGSNGRGILRHDKAFTKFLVNKYFKSSPPPLSLSASHYVTNKP
ncbi:hypothetical protein [Dyadobacter sp. CY356]|uniref:hypothetical protein n=1 Tax=Dyadobacter sp. CY356 TaxID=2906442 RepID=UPI001F19A90E|nr:hypothetical protein [Dyadobacter sp. CY356]MCF0054654.1 hypothetical protein [Dyadobacter sp. CY356]